MINYYVLTLFPEMIENAMQESMTGRAIEKGIINLEAVNIRDYTKDKHSHVDDAPYGGGAGMLMQVQPVYDAYKHIEKKVSKGTKVLFMSPSGKTFSQEMAKELSKEKDIIFLCGHYEGIDERALELLNVENVSIGDYVLTGGELPALVMMDTISRLVPGVLNKEESYEEESFSDGLLEYPQYTRPYEYMGMKVPDTLLSGHHKNIAKWRHEESLKRTRERRPDLYEKYIEKEKEKKKDNQ